MGTIVIATPSHQRAFVKQMRSMGADPDHLAPMRDIVWLDARATLSAFMEGNRPNAELFEATVGNTFEKLTANRRYALVRAYGEMVDLRCAYARESLVMNAREDGVEMICRTHSRVLPPKRVA